MSPPAQLRTVARGKVSQLLTNLKITAAINIYLYFLNVISESEVLALRSLASVAFACLCRRRGKVGTSIIFVATAETEASVLRVVQRPLVAVCYAPAPHPEILIFHFVAGLHKNELLSSIFHNKITPKLCFLFLYLSADCSPRQLYFNN